MKEGQFNQVLDRMIKLHEKTIDKVSRDLKGVKPFNQEEVTPRQIMTAINDLTMEDVAEFGMEPLLNLYFDAQRRTKDAQAPILD